MRLFIEKHQKTSRKPSKLPKLLQQALKTLILVRFNMEGIIVNFRRSRTTYTPRHFIIQPENCDSKEKALKLVGKTVEWKNPQGKEKAVIKGKIASAHGCKGCVRVIFERGLPGQAVATKVEIK